MRRNKGWKILRQLSCLVLLGLVASLASCVSSPPAKPDNLCAIFDEKGGWHRAAKRARKKWGLPIHIGMAFVHRESHYVANAKPPRRRLLGLVPWTRLSSAYGYAQATDEAWQDYLDDTNPWFVDRDDFTDALDFIGWYNHRSHRRLGISKQDSYHLYLAYYTGATGYERGAWKNSSQIKGYASKVKSQAARYQAQLQRCG